jgi:N-acetyl-gamma-glutamyl-phosphate reductase
MKHVVFVDGQEGTTGLRIHEVLGRRADIELLSIDPEKRKDPAERARLLNAADVAFLCLPDAAAREAAAMVENPAVRIIDASSAHRTDPAWVYGLPELSAEQPGRIRQARRISNPGCYPTGAVALLRPLVDAGLLPPEHAVSIHAVSGYSGRGRAGVEAHEGPGATAAPPFQVYGLALEHKHVPEIQQQAGLAERPFFVPAYGHFRQGIVLTIPLHLRLLPSDVSGRRIREALAERYRGSRHVQVLSAEATAALEHLEPQRHNGSNDMSLAVFDNPARGQVLLAAVFDNLGKGASGAALQNLDLVLGSAA